MRGLTGVAIAAVIAGVAAQPHAHNHHQHQHLHRHIKHQDLIEKRAKDVVVVTEVVKGPTVTEYRLADGKKVGEEEAQAGIKDGGFVVVGTSTPSPFVAPPPIVSTSSGGGPNGGQFFEQKTSSAAPAASSAPAPAPPPPPPPAPKKANEDENGYHGEDEDFPSNVPCSEFPSAYGARKIGWLKNTWTTVMKVGKLQAGVKLNNIHQANDGGCQKGDICSYACWPGYQKTQWPEESQGLTGQSVGGLYCNDQGFLELTRPAYTKLCEKGAGGVFVRNELSKNAAVCRTDYPGNEMMSIPVDTYPGQTYPLTNPVSSTYYKWENKPTTAQYYVNNEGVPVEEACVWDSPTYPLSAGNWAPTNVGVGKDEHGITYLSIFPNQPTTTAVLNFNIEIEGDYSGECWLRNGVYAKPNGCTIGIKEGGSATLVFKKA